MEGANPRPTWCVISWRLTTSAGAEVGAPGRRALRKKASPFQGEAVERSETDEGAHGDNGRPSLRPLIRHLLRKCHLPPRREGFAGGHMGPPLRILTDGAYGRKHLIRHGLRPCHLPLKGKAGEAHPLKPSPLGEGAERSEADEGALSKGRS